MYRVGLTQVLGPGASTASRQQEWPSPIGNEWPYQEAYRYPPVPRNSVSTTQNGLRVVISPYRPQFQWAPHHDLLAFTRQPRRHARSHLPPSNAMVRKAASPRVHPRRHHVTCSLNFPFQFRRSQNSFVRTTDCRRMHVRTLSNCGSSANVV